MKTQKLLALLAVSLLGLSGRANAVTSATLLDLATPGGVDTLSIGDKTFSNFFFFPSGTPGLTGFDASQILVTASVDSSGVYYLTYNGSIALTTGSGGGNADLVLKYTVTANAGQIFMIDQNYTGSVQGTGNASLAVDETVRSGPIVVANSHLQVGDLSDPFAEPGDNLIIDPPLATVNVTKDIFLSNDGSGTVTISEVSQSFHQNVPDGGTTVLLLGAALSGLGLIRRKLS
jgi:hypothetical protein